MQERPTCTQIDAFEGKMTAKSKEQYGLSQRSKAGWGENTALNTTLDNTIVGRWFDVQWTPQYYQPEDQDTVNFTVNTVKPADVLGQLLDGRR
ncbi:hypothetical protein EWW49_27585 [Pseudomonas syringae]|nr:hypothetical protein EWW49_27585 [Pseudomonas syringae]